MKKIGILDPKGINKNPLNDKEYSPEYKELAKKWSTLPVYLMADTIIDTINNNQVIMTIAATSGGKSVLVVKFALHTLNYKGKVIMTLPKQSITKAAAEFSAKTLDVKLGEEVGYQFRGEKKVSDKTKILYATDGSIVQMLIKDPKLTGIDIVVIDEAHEFKIQVDFLLYLLKETMQSRPEFKLIIMSATIDSEPFEAYFSQFKFAKLNLAGATNHPIDAIYLDKDVSYDNILEIGFQKLINILETDDPSTPDSHDILFFITSSNEAFQMCDKLNKYLTNISKNKKECKIICNNNVYCIEVFANMDATRQKLATDKDEYKKLNHYNRKVIFATNVAESSLTIDGIKYVIESGYELSSSYNPQYKAKVLERQLITQAQALQRRGRAGRTEPGICYHMYTKNTFNNIMQKYPQPAIKVSDITSECLKLLTVVPKKNVEQLIRVLCNFINPPKEEFIRDAINTLIKIGAIENNELTNLGELVANLPITTPFASLALIIAKMHNCSHEVLKIIAICETIKNNLNDLYVPTKDLPKDVQTKFDKSRKNFADKYGDHLTLLNIYNKFEKTNESKMKEWAYKNFLKLDVLYKIKKHLRKLKGNIYSIDMTIDMLPNNEIINSDPKYRILYSLMRGYRLNIAHEHNGFYKTGSSNDLKIKLSSKSFLTKNPKKVFYNELFISQGRSDINIVSEIPTILSTIQI
jgi:pre-mRNA-splicing factor ATP-dependent RNA helicase DHX15/PRP43